MPVDLYAPVTQLTMFIVVVCNVMMGVSRHLGDLILSLLTITLQYAFLDKSGNLSLRQQSILDQIPRTMNTVLSRFNLDSKTMTYTVCPNCHCTYPPKFAHGSTVPSYPTECDNRPHPDSNLCRTSLVESTDDGIALRPNVRKQKTGKRPQPIETRKSYLCCMVYGGQSSGVFPIGIRLKCS